MCIVDSVFKYVCESMSICMKVYAFVCVSMHVCVQVCLLASFFLFPNHLNHLCEACFMTGPHGFGEQGTPTPVPLGTERAE